MGGMTAEQGRKCDIDFLRDAGIPRPEFWVDTVMVFWKYLIQREHKPKRCEWVYKDDGFLQNYYFYRGIFIRLGLDSHLALLNARWNKSKRVPGEMETEVVNAALTESSVQHPETWGKLYAATHPWSPATHHRFDSAFKQGVFTLLCCNLYLQWPPNVLYQIIANLCDVSPSFN